MSRIDIKGVPERAAIIDEYGELSRKVREFRPIADRAEVLRKTIAGWYDNELADEAYLAEGTRYNVQVSPRAIRRRIASIPKLVKLLGKELFLRLATIRLEDIDTHMSEAEQSRHGVVAVERSGPRRVEAVLRPIPIDSKKKK